MIRLYVFLLQIFKHEISNKSQIRFSNKSETFLKKKLALMRKIEKFYNQLGLSWFLILFFLVWLLFAKLYSFIESTYFASDYETVKVFNHGLWIEVLEVAIMGPLVETIINQFLIIKLTKKILDKFSIFLSAIVFAILHRDYYWFVYFFVFGLILATLFYFFQYITKRNAFLICFLFHFTWNLYAVLESHLSSM